MGIVMDIYIYLEEIPCSAVRVKYSMTINLAAANFSFFFCGEETHIKEDIKLSFGHAMIQNFKQRMEVSC